MTSHHAVCILRLSLAFSQNDRTDKCILKESYLHKGARLSLAPFLRACHVVGGMHVSVELSRRALCKATVHVGGGWLSHGVTK